MAAAGGVHGSEPGPGSAPCSAGDTSLLGSATTWPLKRYGRFLPPKDGDDEGQNTSWKVFESNEESGPLVLTIVVSGHFFISQGRTVLPALVEAQPATKDSIMTPKTLKGEFCLEGEGLMLMTWKTLLEGGIKCVQCTSPVLGGDSEEELADKYVRKEGFSLIDSHKWLKIVRRAECLLLRAHAKNECRMFRVQFGGNCREEMQEHCCSCVQKLSEYVPVQGAEEQSQQLCHGLSQDTQGMDTEHGPEEPLPDSCSSFGERRSVAQLAQSVLQQRPELPPALRPPMWSARELGPLIRLCLLDQHFPAFVEDVERELRKLTQE